MNINDQIKVKLTKYGESILKDYWQDIEYWSTHAISASDKFLEYPYITKDNEYFIFELWNFMQIFGKYFYMGGQQIVEKNEIILCETTPINKNIEIIEKKLDCIGIDFGAESGKINIEK